MTDAIVIGAGASGLMAARELKRAGRTVCVLEASDRIGGRVHTLYNTTAGVPVELGAEFIHGDAPETTRLLDEARLAMLPVTGEHYRSDRGELSPQGPVWKRMSLVFRHLNPDRKNDRSFQDFLDDKPGGRALARERQLAKSFVQGFDAADTTLISEKSLALQGNPTEGAAQARRPANGYGALIDFISRDVVQDIRFNARATRVVWEKSSVRVVDQSGNEYDARAVVIAVPLPMLQDDSISIEPEIDSLRNAARQMVMGHVVHAAVVVKERFWEKKIDQMAYVHAPLRPFNVWWTQHPLQAHLITGWSGGPPATELLANAQLTTTAIHEMARVFGMTLKRAESLVDTMHVHDWSHDPNIRGAYAYPGIGGAYAARMLARSIDDTVFIAGEATDSGSGGTVEAAIASGKRAAQKILKTAKAR